MVVLYLSLKVVFILCRFHVDKLSSAHVYLRLHKVTGFKHGFVTFSLVMSIISGPLSFFFFFWQIKIAYSNKYVQ